MTPDLLLILTLRVDDDFGDEPCQDIFEEFWSEVEGCPVMSLLEDFQNIACDSVRR